MPEAKPRKPAPDALVSSDKLRSEVSPHLVAWPGLPIRLSGYVRAQRYDFDPTGSLLAPAGPYLEEGWRGQIYLELLAVDLANPQSILAFADRFGTLGVFTSWE